MNKETGKDRPRHGDNLMIPELFMKMNFRWKDKGEKSDENETYD